MFRFNLIPCIFTDKTWTSLYVYWNFMDLPICKQQYELRAFCVIRIKENMLSKSVNNAKCEGKKVAMFGAPVASIT